MTYPQALQLMEQLQVGDRIEVRHEVKVGFRRWTTITSGVIEHMERRRHSLHFRRNQDDKVYSDMIVLQRDGGERTTITIDEFTDIKKLDA